MKKIQNRLKRLEGQIRGLQKLLETANDCEKIIIQFSAAKSALDNCYALLLTENLSKCFKNKEDKDLEKLLKLIIKK
jgi:DNA-binding FrmR family transcriptional regulator